MVLNWVVRRDGHVHLTDSADGIESWMMFTIARDEPSLGLPFRLQTAPILNSLACSLTIHRSHEEPSLFSALIH